MFRIKEPLWGTGGCVANEHIETPEGWLGYRSDSIGFVVTGIFNGHWRDDKVFKDRQDAKDYILELYRQQVKKWLVHQE